MKAPWTEAHRREAMRRAYELAAELVTATMIHRARVVTEGAMYFAETERQWRHSLELSMSFAQARIDREVRRVRALAEGRLVREEMARLRWPDGTQSQELPLATAREAVRAGTAGLHWQYSTAAPQGARVVRVARIRRAR